MREPVTDFLFHYTSSVAAQMVRATGSLMGSAMRPLYLTDPLFRTASDAANALGIPVIGPAMGTLSGPVQLTKPVDVICAIPRARVDERRLSALEVAEPFRDLTNNAVIYSGGGSQFRYYASIDVDGLPWMSFVQP